MLEALGHYKILGRIGTGRMGDLFRARDTRAGRTVAIRVVADHIANDPRRREQFLAAARPMTALSHPNIAALYEVGEDQGHLFLVSEFVPGDTLKTVIAGRALNSRHAIDHGIQLADALADVHAEGVVHRDIRPATVIITPKGIAKFIDVGLAVWTAGGIQRDTIPGQLAGSHLGKADAVAYMSPEQVLGEEVDQRTDIFSLGVVLFEMVAGRPPFAGADAGAVAMQILQAQPPLPSSVNRALPADLDAIVLKMLAKSLDQRYESAAALAAELRSVAAILDVRDGVTEPVAVMIGPPKRRSAGPAFFVVLAVVVIAALLLMATDAGDAWLASLTRAWRSMIE